MSNPEPKNDGFTLLECLVAVLILNLLVLGMVRLISGHHEVLDSVDDWSYGNPSFYVIQDPDPLARALGAPATLSIDPPSQLHTGEDEPYDIVVLEINRGLEPEFSSTLVKQIEQQEKKKENQGKSEDKGKGGKD